MGKNEGRKVGLKGAGGGGEKNQGVKKDGEKIRGEGQEERGDRIPATSPPENQGVERVVQPLITSQIFR